MMTGTGRIRALARRLRPFPGSSTYWERRYAAGGTSGSGSYGENARAKADYVNRVVEDNGVESVVDFGCGDGEQLSLLRLPSYLGVDVSPSAIDRCRSRFGEDRTKRFVLLTSESSGGTGEDLSADLALSQEVIFHLIEDDVYETYMAQLFSAARRFVLIFGTDFDLRLGKHERHRTFTSWVDAHCPEWSLIDHVRSPRPYDERTGEGMLSDFYLYGREPAASA
jgi:SAM-dependent methyltransferase